MHLTKSQIENADQRQRANIINCITGPKPAMLLGTKSSDGATNLAIFSNVIHLGADPAMMGVLFRPQDENPRDTYLNIKNTGTFTLNHVPKSMVQNAHFTSARFAPGLSEFDQCMFSEEYLPDFHAPFVGESRIKIGLRFSQQILIEANKTILLTGEIEHLLLPDESITAAGQVDLEKTDSVSAGGLHTYYGLNKLAEFPYAKADKLPDFGS